MTEVKIDAKPAVVHYTPEGELFIENPAQMPVDDFAYVLASHFFGENYALAMLLSCDESLNLTDEQVDHMARYGIAGDS